MVKKKYPTLKNEVEDIEEAVILWTEQIREKLVEVDMNFTKLKAEDENILALCRNFTDQLSELRPQIERVEQWLALPWWKRVFATFTAWTPGISSEPREPID